MSFTTGQTECLTGKLDPNHVKKNPRGFSYIEGWKAIDEANRIFGFGEWDRETVQISQLGERYENDNKNTVINYMAKVRITVRDADGIVVREGCGFGSGIDKDHGRAHESAIKEAETDAMKRALMTFGNPFGLALYDKEQVNVGFEPSGGEVAALNAVNAAADRTALIDLLARDKDMILALPNGGADRVRDRANERLKHEFKKAS